MAHLAHPDFEIPLPRVYAIAGDRAILDTARAARRAGRERMRGSGGMSARGGKVKAEVTIDEFQRLDLRAGVIAEVEDFPRARKPAYRVTVDFGPELGFKRSSIQATNYTRDELVGMPVVGVVNLPPRNIAGFLSEVLLLGVPGEDGLLSLLTPSRPARPGGTVY